MAVASAGGIWFAGRILLTTRIKLKWRSEAVFPVFVLIVLAALILLLYVGPTSIGGSVSGNDSYGTGARAELFWRSLRLVSDFPFTGGGLGAFPGLYSQYILGIPNYYLPNAHNDFIFAIIGEELGYLGAGVVILMFGVLTWVGMRIAGRVADPFLRLMAATITTLIALQAIINMGSSLHLMPTKGMTLPFISYGGSSLLALAVGMGMALALTRKRFGLEAMP